VLLRLLELPRMLCSQLTLNVNTIEPFLEPGTTPSRNQSIERYCRLGERWGDPVADGQPSEIADWNLSDRRDFVLPITFRLYPRLLHGSPKRRSRFSKN